MHHFVCLYLRRFGRVFVVLFLHLCVRWMHPRSLVDLHNGRGVLCVALREELFVGRSVGRLVVVCVGSQRESWCVSSLGSSMRSWGVVGHCRINL